MPRQAAARRRRRATAERPAVPQPTVDLPELPKLVAELSKGPQQPAELPEVPQWRKLLEVPQQAGELRVASRVRTKWAPKRTVRAEPAAPPLPAQAEGAARWPAQAGPTATVRPGSLR
jgi:hypothetical protein